MDALYVTVMTFNDKTTGLRDAVRALREARGLSYAQMGVRSGLDGSTIWKMEQTGRGSMETVAQLARAFGLPVNDWLILAGYDPIEPSPEEAVEALASEWDRYCQEEVKPLGLSGKVSRQSLERARLLIERLDREEAEGV